MGVAGGGARAPGRGLVAGGRRATPRRARRAARRGARSAGGGHHPHPQARRSRGARAGRPGPRGGPRAAAGQRGGTRRCPHRSRAGAERGPPVGVDLGGSPRRAARVVRRGGPPGGSRVPRGADRGGLERAHGFATWLDHAAGGAAFAVRARRGGVSAGGRRPRALPRAPPLFLAVRRRVRARAARAGAPSRGAPRRAG